MIHLPVLVVLLNVLLLFATGLVVAGARGRHGVKAPATTGHPDFERAFRVQMNALEHTVVFLPTLWLAVQWGNPTWAGILGLAWIAARVWYVPAYLRSAEARHYPFTVSDCVAAVAGAGDLGRAAGVPVAAMVNTCATRSVTLRPRFRAARSRTLPEAGRPGSGTGR